MFLYDIQWKFWTISILNFETDFLEKIWSSVFKLKAIRLKMHHFHTKLPYQKPMLKQIEWGVWNEPITKNGVLPVTTLFFWKFYFSQVPLIKSWSDVRTTQMPIFVLFVSRFFVPYSCFFPCEYPSTFNIQRTHSIWLEMRNTRHW